MSNVRFWSLADIAKKFCVTFLSNNTRAPMVYLPPVYVTDAMPEG